MRPEVQDPLRFPAHLFCAVRCCPSPSPPPPSPRLPPPFPHLGGHGDEYGMAQVDHHVSAEDQPELGARRQLVLVGGQGGEHAQYGAQ